MTETGDELRKELAECTINVANLIEQKNAEIKKLRAALERIMARVIHLSDPQSYDVLLIARKALAEQKD